MVKAGEGGSERASSSSIQMCFFYSEWNVLTQLCFWHKIRSSTFLIWPNQTASSPLQRLMTDLLLFCAEDPLYLYSMAADRGRLVGPSLLWEAGCPPGCPSAARWSSTEPPCGQLGLGPGEEALLHAGSSGRPFGLKHFVSFHTGWDTEMT